MIEPSATLPAPCIKRVTVVGTLPPLRAISSYCEGMAMALADRTEVEFFNFSALYPKFLYPGAALADDSTANEPKHPNLQIERRLAWFNPLSWIIAGYAARGDIINIQWWSVPLAPIMITVALIGRARGIPIVTTVHNVTPHGGNRVLHRWTSKILYRLSTSVLLHSRHNEEAFHKLFPEHATRTVVCPMGTANFKKGREIDKQASRRFLGIPEKKQVLLMFGALRPYKGWDVAINAMNAIKQAVPDALLIIAGKPWDSNEPLTSLVETQGLETHVRLDLDFVKDDEIHHYLSAADVLLMPYKHFDAQSGIGTSGLSYGLPVVVSNCGGLQDLVIDDQSIVPRSDPQRLADRLVEILTNPALMRMLKSHSEFLAQRYSWSSISKTLCDLFLNLAGQHPHPRKD